MGNVSSRNIKRVKKGHMVLASSRDCDESFYMHACTLKHVLLFPVEGPPTTHHLPVLNNGTTGTGSPGRGSPSPPPAKRALMAPPPSSAPAPSPRPQSPPPPTSQPLPPPAAAPTIPTHYPVSNKSGVLMFHIAE